MKDEEAQLIQRNKLLNKLITKAWQDSKFKEELLKDPKSAIEKSLGISVPDFIQIKIHQETPKELHLVLPLNPCEVQDMELSSEELEIISRVGALCHITEQQSYGTC